MGRDIKFEIQFLLALTLVVFGLMSIDVFRGPIDPRVGYALILFLSVHLSLFNLYYAYGEALDYSIDFVEQMNDSSGWTLFATTASFGYFIFHWILSLFFESGLQYLIHVQYHAAGEAFIEYVVPIIVIALMGYSYNENVKQPYDRFRNINIKIFPQDIRVFSTAGDSKPFSIKVENTGDDEFWFQLEITISEDVLLHHDGQTYSEEFLEEFTVEPQRQEKLTFEVSYDGARRQMAEIEVTVHFDGGHKTETITADLVAQ